MSHKRLDEEASKNCYEEKRIQHQHKRENWESEKERGRERHTQQATGHEIVLKPSKFNGGWRITEIHSSPLSPWPLSLDETDRVRIGVCCFYAESKCNSSSKEYFMQVTIAPNHKV